MCAVQITASRQVLLNSGPWHNFTGPELTSGQGFRFGRRAQGTGSRDLLMSVGYWAAESAFKIAAIGLRCQACRDAERLQQDCKITSKTSRNKRRIQKGMSPGRLEDRCSAYTQPLQKHKVAHFSKLKFSIVEKARRARPSSIRSSGSSTSTSAISGMRCIRYFLSGTRCAYD